MAIPAINLPLHRDQLPITAEACARLEEEAARLSREAGSRDAHVTGRLDGDSDAPTFVPNVLGQQLVRRLANVRSVLERAIVVNDPEIVVIGRQVTLRERAGSTARYEIVIPGEGNASAGMVSVDSPVGAALLGRRVGDVVTISAPAGRWAATIVEVT